MKCPVCDQENSTMLCPQCSFDASRDYERYPTFGLVSRMPSVSSRKKQWQDPQKQSIFTPDKPQFVDYQEMVSDAAKADEHYRQSREYQLLRSLQAANDEIAELKRDKREYEKRIESLKTELRTLTHYVYPENQTLKERINTLDKQNKALIQENIQMEDNVHDLVTKLHEAERLHQEAELLHQEALNQVSSLKKKNTTLEKQLEKTENYLKNANDGLNIRAREMADLKAAMEKEKQKYLKSANEELNIRAKEIADLKAELEAERSKGVLARLFNR